ncbi:MAG TPA: universal stress protein [Candidatus Binatia bacterium]
MLRITRILAPTDLSELSKDGVHAALDLARSHGATVTIYNVLEFERAHSSSPELEQHSLAQLMERKKILAQFVDENLSDAAIGLEVFEYVEAGAEYKKIIDRARRENSDLIVITTHGKTGLLDALIGSVAELVIRLAPCPVLSVHPAMRQQNVEPKAA